MVVQNLIRMEEKSKSEMNLSMSDWKLKQGVLRNQRNYRQLENRLVILEMEKEGKIKSIERKLEAHKKLMEIRMDRFKLRQDIERHEQEISQEAGSNSRVFQEIRKSRAANIRSKSSLLKDINNKFVKEIRKQREDNEKSIRMQSEKELLLKTEKRNRVRLIQIECKENVDKFWKNRLGELKEMREVEMLKRMEQQEKKLQWLMSLQKSEQELLKQIKKTEEMESQLVVMMNEEKSMIAAAINTKA